MGSGAYVPASIDTLGSERVLDDAWVLVPALFAPAYIGGRTAAEHWDLTEQIFKDVVVITPAIREKPEVRQGFQFTLKHLNVSKIFGTKPVWRHNTKVPVADVHSTIVDMLDDPALGGGIQQVSDYLNSYLKRADRDDQRSSSTLSGRATARCSNGLVSSPKELKAGPSSPSYATHGYQREMLEA